MSKKPKTKKINKGSKIELNNTRILDIDYPIFDLRYLHKDYSLKAIKNDDKVSLINQLHLLSQFSWNELRQAPRHGMGTEKIAKNAINPSIPDCKWITQNTVFLALRYHGLKEIVGIRNGSVFHILYIDYNRTVYDH